MSDNPSPFEIHPDEHIEARITAWVLGEASPFEAAELEALVEKSPELKLFHTRLLNLHALLPEAEDHSGTGDEEWKLPPSKKIRLTRTLGATPEIPQLPAKTRDPRRFAKITAFAIAACALFAAFMIALLHPELTERTLALKETPEVLSYFPAAESPEFRKRHINELRKAIREQEDKVNERRKVLTTISRTKDVAYYGDGNKRNEENLEESQGAAYVMQESNRLEGEKVQLENQIESLLKYDDEQLNIYASGLDVPDNIVKTLLPQQLELKRQIDGLKASGLADNHPTIRTNQRVLDDMEEQLDEGVVNLRTRLQGQLETSKERLAKVEIMRENAKRDNLERSIDTQDYVDAKRDFETDQALLEQMKLNLVSKEIEIKAIPDSVVFHDLPPAPHKNAPQAPSSPMTGKAIAANTSSSVPIPAPSLAPAEPSLDFGDGNNFGAGWSENAPGERSAALRRRESAPMDTQPSPGQTEGRLQATAGVISDARQASGKLEATDKSSPSAVPVPTEELAMNEQDPFSDTSGLEGDFRRKNKTAERRTAVPLRTRNRPRQCCDRKRLRSRRRRSNPRSTTHAG